MTYKLQLEHTGLVKPGTVDSQIVQFVLFTYIQTRNYGINNMNLEHITEWVLHVYSMAIRYILCCYKCVLCISSSNVSFVFPAQMCPLYLQLNCVLCISSSIVSFVFTAQMCPLYFQLKCVLCISSSIVSFVFPAQLCPLYFQASEDNSFDRQEHHRRDYSEESRG